MLLENDKTASFKMRYFNSDGREATMCGNGGRCIAAFAVHQNVVKDPANFIFTAVDGLHKAAYKNGIVSLKMANVKNITTGNDHYFLDTGSPHHVTFVKNIETADVYNQGKEIRLSKAYEPEGTNVNFVEIISDKEISVRTFERGVEDETYSCGTGVVASAISTSLKKGSGTDFHINIKGGELNVSFDPIKGTQVNNIWLKDRRPLYLKAPLM